MAEEKPEEPRELILSNNNLMASLFTLRKTIKTNLKVVLLVDDKGVYISGTESINSFDDEPDEPDKDVGFRFKANIDFKETKTLLGHKESYFG